MFEREASIFVRNSDINEQSPQEAEKGNTVNLYFMLQHLYRQAFFSHCHRCD